MLAGVPPNRQIVEKHFEEVVLSDGLLEHEDLILLQHHITERLLQHFLPELDLEA